MANKGDCIASAAQFENLSGILSGMKSRDRKTSMLDHMQLVFNELIQHYPSDSINKLEEVSYLVKKKEDLSKWLRTEDNRNYSENAVASKDFITKALAQFPGAAAGGEEEGEAEALPEIGFVQDLINESSIWQWANIGFGEAETYRL